MQEEKDPSSRNYGEDLSDDRVWSYQLTFFFHSKAVTLCL